MKSISDFVGRVIYGDCLSVLPQLPAGSVDLVLTDPPYLTGYRDRSGRGLAGDGNPTWLAPAFAQLYRVLKPDSFCVSFYGWPRVDLFFDAWRAAGFRPVGHLVWPKGYTSRRGYVASQHEQAYLLAKGRPRQPDRVMRDVLPWQYTGNKLHPTQKPVSGLLPVIGAFSRRGDVVLDSFCGSGSTLEAADMLGRRYVGIEINAEHAKAAQSRMLGRRL